MPLSKEPIKFMATSLNLQVSVVFSPNARLVQEVQLSLPAGSNVLQALAASGLWAPLAKTDPTVGIWGRKVALDQLVRDKDRIEIYRDLTVDPKVARRERFVKQGSKGTGLFAKKRPGAAAGY
jgi:putative ubiquitin-RnfH superfamily antitoxin RatB of RatAB toxin-antitoxin module